MPTCGKIKELVVKTEWKYASNKLALSPSEVAVKDSKLIVGGRDSWRLTYLIYLNMLELSYGEAPWISLVSNKIFAAISLCCKSDSRALSLERI